MKSLTFTTRDNQAMTYSVEFRKGPEGTELWGSYGKFPMVRLIWSRKDRKTCVTELEKTHATFSYRYILDTITEEVRRQSKVAV